MTAPVNQEIGVRLFQWRNRRGQFTTATRTARERQAHAAQRWMKVAVPLAEKESPIGNRARASNDRRRKPKETPRFKDSWRGDFRKTPDGGAVTIENIAAHAPFVIFPTKAHTIQPVRARRLVFEPSGGGTGRFVFARKVRHPGTKGNTVPARVLRAMESWGQDELARVAREVVTEIRDIFTD